MTKWYKKNSSLDLQLTQWPVQLTKEKIPLTKKELRVYAAFLLNFVFCYCYFAFIRLPQKKEMKSISNMWYSKPNRNGSFFCEPNARLNVIKFYLLYRNLYMSLFTWFVWHCKQNHVLCIANEWMSLCQKSLYRLHFIYTLNHTHTHTHTPYHRKRIQLLTSMSSIKISNFQTQTKIDWMLSFFFYLEMERARARLFMSACAKCEILANRGWCIWHTMLLPHPFFIQTKMHMHRHTRMLYFSLLCFFFFLRHQIIFQYITKTNTKKILFFFLSAAQWVVGKEK